MVGKVRRQDAITQRSSATLETKSISSRSVPVVARPSLPPPCIGWPSERERVAKQCTMVTWADEMVWYPSYAKLSSQYSSYGMLHIPSSPHCPCSSHFALHWRPRLLLPTPTTPHPKPNLDSTTQRHLPDPQQRPDVHREPYRCRNEIDHRPHDRRRLARYTANEEGGALRDEDGRVC